MVNPIQNEQDVLKSVYAIFKKKFENIGKISWKRITNRRVYFEMDLCDDESRYVYGEVQAASPFFKQDAWDLEQNGNDVELIGDVN